MYIPPENSFSMLIMDLSEEQQALVVGGETSKTSNSSFTATSTTQTDNEEPVTETTHDGGYKGPETYAGTGRPSSFSSFSSSSSFDLAGLFSTVFPQT